MAYQTDGFERGFSIQNAIKQQKKKCAEKQIRVHNFYSADYTCIWKKLKVRQAIVQTGMNQHSMKFRIKWYLNRCIYGKWKKWSFRKVPFQN